jgi:hypothetical protein
MFIRIFAFLGLAFAFSGTQCWAVPTSCTAVEGPPCIRNTFSRGNTTGVYDFTSTGDGRLVVHFVKVLTTFTLDVTVDHIIDGHPGFPDAVCVSYSTNGSQCDEYDFTGSVTSNPPHNVPVQNQDYKGLITLTLDYFTIQTVHSPAFLHAPGASPVFKEDILTSYSAYPPCPPTAVEGLNCNNPPSGDPTMTGKTPGLSTVAAFDEPGADDCFVWISPTDGQPFQAGQEIEVEFQLFDRTTPTTCGSDPIRDKDARLSLSRVDNGQLTVVPIGKDEGAKHFHFDNEHGVNELEVDTEGLKPGVYIITVVSDEFTQQTRTVVIN